MSQQSLFARSKKRWWLVGLFVVVLAGIAVYWLLLPKPIYGPAKKIATADFNRIRQGKPRPDSPKIAPQLKTQYFEHDPDTDGESAEGQPERVASCSISGRVFDKATNKAVAGAAITLSRIVYGPVEGEEALDFEATSDAQGAYTLTGNVAEGDVVLFASAEGYATGSAKLDVVRPNGTYKDIDFALEPAVARVTGKVVNQKREPLPGALVRVITGPTGAGQAALSDEQGAFLLALPAEGDVVLLASKKGYGTERFDNIATGSEPLTLILLEAGAIEGVVKNDKGEPKRGLNVIVTAEDTQEGSGFTGRLTARTNADGWYRIEDLSPKSTFGVRIPFSIRGDLRDDGKKKTGLDAHVFDALQEEREMEEFIYKTLPDAAIAKKDGVRVYPGQTATVDLTVKDNETLPASVYGRVTDPASGTPVCPSMVQAYWSPQTSSTTWLGQTTTGTDGYYQLQLTKVSKPEKVWIMAGYGASPPIGIKVEPGVPKELNLTVSAPIVVPVRCVDGSGASLAGLEIGYRFTTDAEGRTTVYGLAPYVPHTLAAFKKGENSSRALLGVSEEFSGKPGETVPEVLIQCEGHVGFLRGQMVVPPEAEPYLQKTPLMFGTLKYEGTSEAAYFGGQLNDDFTFMSDPIQAGRCTVSFMLPIRRSETKVDWWGIVEDVEIVEGQTTDLGAIELFEVER